MAVPITEDIIWRQLPIDSPESMRQAVMQALVDAGWTHDADATIPLPYSIGTFTGLPNNNGTITIGSVVYTWKTALSNGGNTPCEVLIGADASGCAANLAAAIAAVSGGGVLYGAGTLINADVTATVPGNGSINVQGVSVEKYGLATTDNCTNFSWAFPFLANVSDRYISVKTEQDQLQYATRVFLPWIPGKTCIGLQIESVDGSLTSAWTAQNYIPSIPAGAVGMHPQCIGFPEIVAHPFGWLIFFRGNPAGLGGCWAQTVQLPIESSPAPVADAVVDSPAAVTAADNSGTGGVVRITIANHSFQAGENIRLTGIAGLPDGMYSVTPVDADHFDVTGTSGYTVSATAGSAIRDAATLVYSPGHGLLTGQNITVTQPGSAGGLDLRGSWQVERVDDDYYRLVGSSALSGPYDSTNPVRAAGPGQCSQVMFCGWDLWLDVNASAVGGFPRAMAQWPYIGGSRSPSWFHHANVGEAWMCYGGLAFWDQSPNAFGDSNVNAMDDLQMYGIAGMGNRQWFGGRFHILDAIVGWSTDGFTGTTIPAGVGYLFNAALVTKDLPMDLVVHDDEGKDWIVIGRQNTGVAMSLLLRVPLGYN